jgi:hypothetical protein
MNVAAHVMSGLAVASCFPAAVTAAADGNPLFLLLGGISALLPDVLDSRLMRYLYRHDAEVAVDPLAPAPQIIADAVAGAIDIVEQHRQPFRLRLHAIRLGGNRCQRYRLHLDPGTRQVTVTLTDVINRAGRPVPNADGVPDATRTASAEFAAPLRLAFTAAIDVGSGDGPHFVFVPDDNGGESVTAQFIPWKRQGSHSIVLGVILAIAAGVIWGSIAGVIVGMAYATHLLLDQLGTMGSSLLWPFLRWRTPGLKLLHGSRPMPNLAVAWLCALALYANLALNAAPPLSPPPAPLRLFLLGGAIPLGLISLIRRHLDQAGKNTVLTR